MAVCENHILFALVFPHSKLGLKQNGSRPYCSTWTRKPQSNVRPGDGLAYVIPDNLLLFCSGRAAMQHRHLASQPDGGWHLQFFDMQLLPGSLEIVAGSAACCPS